LNPEPIISCIKKCRNDASYTLNIETICDTLSAVLGEKIKSAADIGNACRKAFLIDPNSENKKVFVEINREFIDDAKNFLSPKTGFQSNISKMTIIMNSFNVEFSNLFRKIKQDGQYKVNNPNLKYLVILQKGFLHMFEYWASCMRSQSAVFLRGIYLAKELARKKKSDVENN
jgi:hypothetical protein